MLPVIQRSFDSSFDMLRELDRWVSNAASEASGRVAAFPVDVYEEQDGLVIEAELPGHRKDQIDVNIEEAVLTITAEAGLPSPEPVVHENADASAHAYEGASENGHSQTESQSQPCGDACGCETEAKSEPARRNHLRERRHVKRVRRFTIPQTFDTHRVSAKLEDGVLTLRLPKREETRPRKVEIG